MSLPSGLYSGQDFLSQDFPTSSVIVENFLWQGDHNLLIGKEKSGKSLLGLQLLCALTSGEPLFGLLHVPEPKTVLYCQGEGKLPDTRHNLDRMLSVLPCDRSRFAIAYFPALPLDTEEGFALLCQHIDAWGKPDVLILDPLYMFMRGDLIENEDARRMVANLRRLGMKYSGLTLLIFHHAHRPIRKEGRILEEGDDSLFGSFVWKAYPDNVYLLEKLTKAISDKRRRLACDTQRMAQVIPSVNLLLEDSNALYYRLAEEKPGVHAKLLEAFHSLNGLPQSLRWFVDQSGYTQPAVWHSLNHYVEAGQAYRTDERPNQWGYGTKPV